MMLFMSWKSMLVQDNQQNQVRILSWFTIWIDKLSNINDGNLDDLDSLLKMAESMSLDCGIDIDNVDYYKNMKNLIYVN
jgi:hypothetical protein